MIERTNAICSPTGDRAGEEVLEGERGRLGLRILRQAR